MFLEWAALDGWLEEGVVDDRRELEAFTVMPLRFKRFFGYFSIAAANSLERAVV